MDETLLSLIKPKNSLLKSHTDTKIKDSIIAHLRTYDVGNLKTDLEFAVLACTWVEHLVSSKTTNDDKIKMTTDILTQIFALTEDEQAVAKTQIAFLFENGSIKKVNTCILLVSRLANWVTKKFL